MEDQEAEILANWLRAKQYTFSHIGNESGQRGTANIVSMMSKKQRLGVSRGFPDYCICLKRGSLLFIELKRQRKRLKSGKLGASPSIVSEEQVQWINELNKVTNVQAEVAYGASEAIEIIERIEKGLVLDFSGDELEKIERNLE